MNQSSHTDIDLVIAWVDGDEPTLKQKRALYQQTTTAASEATAATRFSSHNEIYYNVASILKYVPFYRYIYIVTDNQSPKFIDEFIAQGLCAPDSIKIIDHKQIFTGYERHLPTFNTRSIETMLWNIPNLSDYFIYLNDDFYFNQIAHIEDFIVENKMIIYGQWHSNVAIETKLAYRKFLHRVTGRALQPKHSIAQMLGSKLAGFDKFFMIHHYPHIIDKNVLRAYLLEHPQLLDNQIQYRFRDVAQFNPISLMNHLKIAKNDTILKPNIPVNYLKNEQSIDDFILGLDDTEIKYGCLQSLDLLSDSAYQCIDQSMRVKLVNYLPHSLG